jgi:hypothetical protein
LAKSVIEILEGIGMKVELTSWNDGLDKADLMLCGQGMNLDFPEIEFYLGLLSSWAYIPSTDLDHNLIMKALHSNSAEVRRDSIEKVGSTLLKDGRITPLLVRGYVHLYRKDRVGFAQVTNYDGDILLWKIRVNGP